MLEWARRGLRAVGRSLVASYVLVAVVIVVLVEAFVLGYEVPRLFSNAKLHAQVSATASSYWAQLDQRYPGGVPAGTLLGQRDHRGAGTVQTSPDGGMLMVPAITGALNGKGATTAAVAISYNDTIIASSEPSRYPPGRSAATELPSAATAAIATGRPKGTSGGTGATEYGSVSWTLYGGSRPAGGSPSGRAFTYLYVQAPLPTGLVNPISAWEDLGLLAGSRPIATVSYALLLMIAPLGVLVGLLGSRRLVRRVRRLERVTVAVADGDYTSTLPISSGRDDVGRLEANVAAMTRQLSSALAAERERAGSEARVAERSRIAREIHDAISQHLFGLRMIASGMRRADPHNEQVQVIERITEEALHDMQALLWQLRPPGLEGAGLAPALEQVCASYRDRLGVTVDATLTDVTLPQPVEEALLRVTQEACTNAVRHGNAHRLVVSMTRLDGHVELAVRDNGIGFDPTAPRTGSGLQHIRERVIELGGTVNIESAPGVGTAVTVVVPAT